MFEESFGVIPFRKNGDILIIQDGHGNWGFPKGHPDGKEDPLKTASRELVEETGLKIVHWIPSDKKFQTRYFNPITQQQKQVTYFPALVRGEVILQPTEIRSYMWVPKNGLDAMLKFKELKELIPWIPTL